MNVVRFILALWGSTSQSPGQVSSSQEHFRDRAMGKIGQSYDKAERIAVAAYRLERALHTGETVAGPGDNGPSVPLRELRREFVKAADAITPELVDKHRYRPDLLTKEVVKVDRSNPTLATALDMNRGEAEQQARAVLKAVGEDRYLKALKGDKAEDADRSRADAHEAIGKQVAAQAARVAKLGGRTTREEIRRTDRRVVGVARVCSHPNKEGHPCAFCAMLMSRGAAYRSTRTASGKYNGDPYHSNCDCVAVEFWTRDEYSSNPRFDLNRELSDEWNEVCGGLPARQQVKAWRKHIDAKRQARSHPPSSDTTDLVAQEATSDHSGPDAGTGPGA